MTHYLILIYQEYLTPGSMHSISNSSLAPVRAVVPVVSYGGETWGKIYKDNKYESDKNKL